MYYYFQDHLGTALVMADAWGHVQQQRVYYPFGGERVITNTVANNYKFTGPERDSETGLDHTLNRQYSSTLGRWSSPDPVRGCVMNPQNFDRYAYVANNPTTRTDPNGDQFCDPFTDPFCGLEFGPPACGGVVSINITLQDSDLADRFYHLVGQSSFRGFWFCDYKACDPRPISDVQFYCNEVTQPRIGPCPPGFLGLRLALLFNVQINIPCFRAINFTFGICQGVSQQDLNYDPCPSVPRFP